MLSRTLLWVAFCTIEANAFEKINGANLALRYPNMIQENGDGVAWIAVGWRKFDLFQFFRGQRGWPEIYAIRGVDRDIASGSKRAYANITGCLDPTKKPNHRG
jgi:hypothetical protein